MFILPFISVLLITHIVFAVDTFTIAGLFHDDNYQAEMAFKYAIKKHNYFNPDIIFKAKIVHVTKTDSFKISKQVCDLISADDGVVAIFGPESPTVSPMVQSICVSFEIPHIQTNYQTKTHYLSTTILNFYPDYQLLAYCLATVVHEFDWDSIAILYETNSGLVRVQEILKITTKTSPPAIVMQLPDGGDYRPLLKKLKKSGETEIIIDCSVDHIHDILQQAKEMGLMEYYHGYLLTVPDAHTLDYSFLQADANITTVRFADPSNTALHNVLRDWEMGEMFQNRRIRLTTRAVLTESILMHDAINFFMQSFRELNLIKPIASRSISCDVKEKWEAGLRLTTYMKMRPMQNALSGTIKFNEWGKRVDFTVQALEIIENIQEKTAFWTPANPDYLNYTRTEDEQMKQIVHNLQKTTVIVSSRIGAPYLMFRQPQFPGEILEGNSRYHGYSMDLIDAISKELNFTYRFELAADGQYGSYVERTETWNGLIGDLLERKAHLAICDLTITHKRREVVDFSIPFMTLGVSILHRKPVAIKRSMFVFLEPLHPMVWIYMIFGNIALCFIIYLVARMAPGDWVNSRPNIRNPKELENIWTLKNCTWLVLGGMMGTGCDLLPKGLSSRMAIAMWWYMIFILKASYTANLTSFLMKEKSGPTFVNAKALSEQSEIKYGTVSGGSTHEFFKTSNFSTYARMWSQMESAKPSVYVKSNAAGVNRVLTTTHQLYAFLMESTSLEYEVAKNCALKQVDSILNNKGYGIAMPVNSAYRSAIDRALLIFQADGTLKRLKKKWWYEMQEKVTCERSVSSSGLKRLHISNVGGVFVLFAVGLTIAFILAIGEFLWNVHTVAVKQRITHCRALKLELKFAMTVWLSEKKTNLTKCPPVKELDNKSVQLYNPLNNGRKSKKDQ